jgi:hypothetical protein
MHFDKIIMNPPYNGNLHLKILQESMKYGDEIVNLSPIRWLQDPLAEYKKNSDFKKFEDIRKQIENLDVITSKEAQNIFDAGIWGDLGIYYITKKGDWDNKSLWKHKFFFDKVIIPTYLSKSGLDKKMTKERGVCDFSRPFIKVSELHGNQGEKDFYEFVSPKYEVAKSKTGGSCAHTFNFDTEEEAKNFWDSLNTNFYRFINICTKVSMNIPWCCAPWLSDYTHHWTDSDLYEYFKLTPEEIKEIECSIK